MSNGMLYCGTGGCGTDVYADEGAGYKKAFDALTFGPVYVTRTGGQVFLYLCNPNVISSHFSQYNALPTEFILKDDQFVENKPPPREPNSPPPAGFAATVTTTSPSTFAADTTGVVNGNFSDVPTLIPGGPNGGTYSVYNPLSGYASLQGVSFSTTNLDGNVNVISAYFYGPNDPPKPYAVNSVYSGTAPDILTITLPMAATAFYLDFTTLFVSTMATFDLSNGFSTTISPTVAYPRSSRVPRLPLQRAVHDHHADSAKSAVLGRRRLRLRDSHGHVPRAARPPLRERRRFRKRSWKLDPWREQRRLRKHLHRRQRMRRIYL